MSIVKHIENSQLRELPTFKVGDTVKVHQKIQEKGKIRIQIFEGLVLARKHGSEAGATFTVRASMSGIGVEKIFPLYSPMIDKIEIVKRATMRRAKLYFLRDKVAREARRALRRTVLVNKSAAPVVTGIEEDPIEVATPTAEEAAAAEQA